MTIVIDAYNVLKQVLGTKYIHEPDKATFIAYLNKYSSQKGHAIILVFDGGPFEWPSKERIKGIYVVHSGIHENADAWIKSYMLHNKAKDLLLVSTDREIGRFVSHLGIETLDALDFYEILRESLKLYESASKKHKESIIKVSETEAPGLDELMLESSRVVPQKVEDLLEDRKSKPRQPSKKERKIMQKLKKL